VNNNTDVKSCRSTREFRGVTLVNSGRHNVPPRPAVSSSQYPVELTTPAADLKPSSSVSGSSVSGSVSSTPRSQALPLCRAPSLSCVSH
jgi:hypothetical protein